MRVARVDAQAKVNLFLRVGPRDASGFHGILTLFQRIDFSDTVVVRAGGYARSLDAGGPALPRNGLGPAEKNLAFRAAAAFSERAGWPGGFSIELTKRIPVGGGLGGGSADAGAVLRALDAIAPTPLGSKTLIEIAAALGSDVPFMASEHVTALGTGRGEILEGLAALESKPVVLVVPRFAIATPDAYRWLDESRPSPATAPALPKLLAKASLASWDQFPTLSVGANDFESPVETHHPELGEIRERLTESGAILARLAGSGSSVFGVFDDPSPDSGIFDFDAQTIATRTSSRVVQVEVLE
jgi:4-diphosphocytidyl-2-C-methyl-D-erythritol kinase